MNGSIFLASSGLLLCIILSGCGAAGIANSTNDDNDGNGGNNGGGSTSSAEGFWYGSTNDKQAVSGVIFNDGTFYVLYSLPSNSHIIAGAVKGTGSFNNGSFSSSSAKDFSLVAGAVFPVTVSASYYEKQSLSGVVSSSAQNYSTTTFTTIYDPSYETPTLLASIAGVYDMQVASPPSSTLFA